MKTNIAIELDDAQRSHLSSVFYNKSTSKMISRKKLNNLVNLMINDLLDEGSDASASDVTKRISREGFTYRFNNIEVSESQYEAGIHKWLEMDV